MKLRSILLLLLAFCLGFSLVACSGKQPAAPASSPEVRKTDYPQKPITMIIPYGEGGITDLTGRQLAMLMEKFLGQPINIVNQSGDSGAVGAKTVLDSVPDGYTILFAAESLGTQRVMGLSEMSYDDFAPIIVTVNEPKVIVVGKDSKYKTLKELIDDVTARPDKVKMSCTKHGSSGYVQTLIYNKLGMYTALSPFT